MGAASFAVASTADLLLNSVDRVIAEFGSEGATLRRVGAEAGLSHTAAAHYYKDKKGLFTAYITRAWDWVADGIEEAAAISDDREALLAAGDSYARFALREPSSFAMMSRLELTNVDDPALWAARERGFLGLAALIERCQNNGWAQDRDPLDLLAANWSMVHGFVDLWVGGPLWAPYDGADMQETLRRLLTDFVDAMDR